MDDYGADREGKLNAERAKGHQAQQVLDNELFKGAVQAVRDDIWKKFKSTNPSEAAALSHQRERLDVLERIVADLTHHMTTGRMASEQLSRIAKIRDRMKIKGWRVS